MIHSQVLEERESRTCLAVSVATTIDVWNITVNNNITPTQSPKTRMMIRNKSLNNRAECWLRRPLLLVCCTLLWGRVGQTKCSNWNICVQLWVLNRRPHRRNRLRRGNYWHIYQLVSHQAIIWFLCHRRRWENPTVSSVSNRLWAVSGIALEPPQHCSSDWVNIGI